MNPSNYLDLKKQDPKNPWPYLAEGKEYCKRRQFGPAIYEFDEAIRRMPLAIDGSECPNFQTYFEAHYERGMAYFGAGKWELALQDLGSVTCAAEKVEDFYRRNPYFTRRKDAVIALLRRLIDKAIAQRQAVLEKMQEKTRKVS